MKVGIKTGQGGYTYEELSRVWQKADALGFDSAWLYDHFIALGDANAPCLEAYATLAALARDTRQLRIGVMATCAPYRNPALLAKLATTIDVISNGRFILGIGAGWYEAEFKSYGYPFRSNPERVEQLRETMQIVRAMWSQDRATFHGKHYSIEEAVNIPKPLQKYPPIWVGITRGTRVMPRLAIRHGDGFNSVTAVSDLALCRQIIEAAEAERQKLGRARDTVTYSLQPHILTGSEREIQEIVAADSRRGGMAVTDYIESVRQRGWLVGKPEECAEKLNQFAEMGIDYFLLAVAGDKLGWPLEIVKRDLLPLL